MFMFSRCKYSKRIVYSLNIIKNNCLNTKDSVNMKAKL
jgi:hypothetical protein